MIKRYLFGNPIETDAVVQTIPVSTLKEEPFELDCKHGFSLTYALKDEDIVYGLGEANRGINKRGFFYVNYCADDPCHTEEKNSLYGAHNFVIVDGVTTFGLFIDYPAKITFDIGYTNPDILTIRADHADLNLYLITGESSYDIVKQFRKLIGTSYIPPFWAFGYQQSRWGYQNKNDILEIADGHQKNDYPLDAIYLDIDYMERFKDFTIDEEKFPDFPQFVDEMMQRGLHLVPIIDAGIKIEKGYSIYEEGLEKNCYCMDENGEPFVVGVWPGDTHLPDVLNKSAREWFGSKYEVLLKDGIEGFWNDMNEPAIFYSKQGIKDAFDIVKELESKELSLDNFWRLKDAFQTVANNPKDHERFYHNINGKKVRHDQVHNLYGYNMTRAAKEAFDNLCPGKRILLFSRSSYIGMHRYGGIWTGDNHSFWSHLLLNIKMMPSLNMCGFLYSGADIGGFGGQTTEDLLLRWIAFAMFTPLMRNHSALGTREQEVFRYPHSDAFKHLLRLRYRLIPYLYSEYMKAALKGECLFRPLAFDYPEDSMARHTEDQLMFGEGLMLAPVYEQNAIGRHVYLPEDMLCIRFTSDEAYTTTPLKQGHHYVEIALNEVVVFLKPHHLLPLCAPVNNTTKIDYTTITAIKNGEIQYPYELYHDDGYTSIYDLKKNITHIR